MTQIQKLENMVAYIHVPDSTKGCTLRKVGVVPGKEEFPSRYICGVRLVQKAQVWERQQRLRKALVSDERYRKSLTGTLASSMT